MGIEVSAPPEELRLSAARRRGAEYVLPLLELRADPYGEAPVLELPEDREQAAELACELAMATDALERAKATASALVGHHKKRLERIEAIAKPLLIQFAEAEPRDKDLRDTAKGRTLPPASDGISRRVQLRATKAKWEVGSKSRALAALEKELGGEEEVIAAGLGKNRLELVGVTKLGKWLDAKAENLTDMETGEVVTKRPEFAGITYREAGHSLSLKEMD